MLPPLILESILRNLAPCVVVKLLTRKYQGTPLCQKAHGYKKVWGESLYTASPCICKEAFEPMINWSPRFNICGRWWETKWLLFEHVFWFVMHVYITLSVFFFFLRTEIHDLLYMCRYHWLLIFSSTVDITYFTLYSKLFTLESQWLILLTLPYTSSWYYFRGVSYIFECLYRRHR